MSRWTERREGLRRILTGARCVHPASVHDAVSARIAEELGFEISMLAGSVASLAVLGGPDLVLLTLSEFTEQARRIGRAGALPLLCDADHGYGNALNVMRTVEELETAGVAALSIEDTLLPQAYATGGKAQLISRAEGVDKVRAALAARTDPALVIAGRTSAPAISGIADAIERLRAYEDAGVDALFAVGIKTKHDLDALAAAVKLPLILGGVGKEIRDPAHLAARGVRICLQGHQPFAASVQALYLTMKALREGVAPESLPSIADEALMSRVAGAAQYARHTKEFLG
jgi:carboxyvinyl-carboxyphosphonate phosphorylmutase